MTMMRVPRPKDCQCVDIIPEGFQAPALEFDPGSIKIMMISEVPPHDPDDYFYATGEPFYMQTTLQAFRDAGVDVASMSDILRLGVYITTAVKCPKPKYKISAAIIKDCSFVLEEELSWFPNLQAILLMGDVAIKAMNYIAKRQLNTRVIPSGSTYRIRNDAYYFDDMRVFPSYLQTGENYLIEKSKRRMIAEDIRSALEYTGDLPALERQA